MASDDVVSAKVEGGDVRIETTDLEGFLARLPETVSATEAGVRFLESPDASLEAVFDYMVGSRR